MDIVYFDNSATTKPHREVIDEVAGCMECCYANPSSAHGLGLAAEKKLRTARERVAGLINARPQEVFFTSGGSESNNTAILGVVEKGDHIITSAIEHPSVMKLLNSLERSGFEVTYLKVDKAGLIDPQELEASIRDNTRLVTVMHVNNEIGSIQPLNEIVAIVRRRSRRIRIHVDAVQSYGKLDIDVRKLDIDMLSCSAHKIHGPKGTGALYIKSGLRPRPLIMGGGQEADLRSGTENVPGISGFGLAADMAGRDMEHRRTQVRSIKEYFISRLQEIDGVVINSPADGVHIPYILNAVFEGLRGEVLLHALEDYKIYVSTGSACSAKKAADKNYVLPAIGIPEKLAEGVIRFSFSYANTKEEVDYTMEALKKTIPFLRRIKK